MHSRQPISTYELNDKNTFNVNFGRRIDRPDYGT